MTGGLVSIVSYSRPSLMIIASQTQFHVERPWGQRGSSRFQPGEGPSRGLLRDYEPSDGTFSSNITFAPTHLTMDRVQNTSSKNYGISNFYTWTGELIILKLPSPSSVPQFIIQLNSGFLVALNPITTRNKIGNIKM